MNLKHFLEKLQSADEGRKQRWLVGSSVVVAILFFFVWATYFNSILSVNETPASGAVADGSGGFSFWQSVKSGSATVYTDIVNSIASLTRKLKAPADYPIAPSH